MDTPEHEGQSTVEEQLAAAEQAAEQAAGDENPFDLSDEEAAAAAGPALQMNVPLQNIILQGAKVQVQKHPESDERAIVVGPVMMAFILPLSGEGAHNVARELTGGIEIASTLPSIQVAR